MGLRDKLRRLEKAAQGKLSHFELADGQRHYFAQEEAFKATFLYFTDSMRADYARDPRPDPPALLQAVASARDRRGALSRVMGGSSFLPVDERALVEDGVFVPRSLVAGREYEGPDGHASNRGDNIRGGLGNDV
jgi:hypothetical protein